jgi:hypothetical protein
MSRCLTGRGRITQRLEASRVAQDRAGVALGPVTAAVQVAGSRAQAGSSRVQVESQAGPVSRVALRVLESTLESYHSCDSPTASAALNAAFLQIPLLFKACDRDFSDNQVSLTTEFCSVRALGRAHFCCCRSRASLPFFCYSLCLLSFSLSSIQLPSSFHSAFIQRSFSPSLRSHSFVSFLLFAI